ncbi:hypothetical protein GDO86_013723 [Hymenochirus boettgeri]|uniref:Nucleolar protein 11 C-terminal domain-containing protein n=1 Tax=Hymenochirus boettgeri TaxID=247094 RepID=A0A8T2JLB5_9PIPI|nr:hypothetical protein GDO86_013723 [Hymenochirus boettgeri]
MSSLSDEGAWPAQLWCHHGKLYIIHGKSLAVIPYFCEPSSLATAFGKNRNLQTSENGSLVDWDLLIAEEPEAKQSSKKTRERKTKAPAENNPKGTSLPPEVQNMPLSQVDGLVQSVVTATGSADYQGAIVRMTQGLVNRCKADPKFYPQCSLEQLIQTNTLSYSLCPGLMSLLMEKQDVRLIRLCLQRFCDIPEAILCCCLKTFLSVCDNSLKGFRNTPQSRSLYM